MEYHPEDDPLGSGDESGTPLETRIETLESEIQLIKQELAARKSWWQRTFGTKETE